jgi:2-methylcitrate dehydratase PrpD
MVANGTWQWTDATGAGASSAESSGLAAAAAVSGSVNCGIKTNQTPWATYATGWASTSASASVYYVSTGITGVQNILWHNNTKFSYGWGSGQPGTYTYAESNQDFKFSWDSVTWQVQSWGSLQTSSTVYVFKNKFCQKTISG